MAKLVVLTEGMTGLSYELKVDKTTIGRVEDNTFQISHASVSSHHGEVLLRGNDVVIKDLQSTNGTFINGEQITDEAVLKPGQVVKFGQVEVRLESGAAAGSSGKKQQPIDSTMVVPKGVSLAQLEQGPQGVDNSKSFAKKQDKSKKILIIAIVAFIVVVGLGFIFALKTIH